VEKQPRICEDCPFWQKETDICAVESALRRECAQKSRENLVAYVMTRINLGDNETHFEVADSRSRGAIDTKLTCKTEIQGNKRARHVRLVGRSSVQLEPLLPTGKKDQLNYTNIVIENNH